MFLDQSAREGVRDPGLYTALRATVNNWDFTPKEVEIHWSVLGRDVIFVLEGAIYLLC